MSQSTTFEYRKTPNEDQSAYTLEILDSNRKVVLTVPGVRPIHVRKVLEDDVTTRLIDMGYENTVIEEAV